MSETFEEQENEDLLATALRVSEAVKNAEGYDELAAAISDRRAEQGESELAVEIADTINDPYTRDRVLADIAVGCAATGHEDYAFELLESLEDFSHQATAATRISVAHAEAGRFERAVEIASNMEDNSSALAEIAAQCAAKGEFDRALDVTEMLDLPLYRALALTRIAESYIKAGRTAEAADLLSQALEEALEMDTNDERATTRAEIALRLAEAGQADEAAQIFSRAIEDAEIAEEPYRESALAQIAISHARLRQFDTAIEVTEKINDVYMAADTLVNLAVIERAEEGREQDALQLLNDAHDLLSGDVPENQKDEAQRWNVLALVAVRYAEFGEQSRALKVVQMIDPMPEKNRALLGIALHLAGVGEADAARQTARGIDEIVSKINAFFRISRPLISVEATAEKGFETLAEAVRLIEQVERPVDRALGLAQSSSLYAEAGRKEKSVVLLRRALAESKLITGEYQKASALLAISDAYAKGGHEPDEEAKEMVWQISIV